MDPSRLIELCSLYAIDETETSRKLPGLSVFRREATSDIESSVYEPVICLILQGSKVTSIGDRFIELVPGDALLVSHDLPVVSRITKASVREPYLAVILSLDLALVRSLYDQVADAQVPEAHGSSLSAGRAEPAWLAPLVRYFELMDNSQDAKVLGPSVLREIHYRLLLSPIGRMLRNLLAADSHASRVAKAIQKLRAGFRSPLSVSELARIAGMSSSSFHQHFKSVTGTTPLQYQKDLRLIAARDLLVNRKRSVSEASYAVGYESPTHFSRDYRRKFRRPPSRDASADTSASQDAIPVGVSSQVRVRTG